MKRVRKKLRRWHRRHRHLAWLGLVLGLVLVASYLLSYQQKLTNDALLSLVGAPVKPTAQQTPGQIVNWRHTGSLTPEELMAQIKTVYTDIQTTPPIDTVESYQFTYLSRDARSGNLVSIVGRAYLPNNVAAAPALVFGPGTTGVGPQCAPSLELSRGKNWGHYAAQMAFYASQGYAVVTTDYDGRTGANAIHHYFVGEMEGRAMLDAARALRTLHDPEHLTDGAVGAATFLAGYSQGGHAALWADQIHTSYAPEVKISGIIGFAPATDLAKTILDTANGASTVWLPPYLLAAYDDYYHLQEPMGRYFLDPFAATIDADARRYCIDQLEVKAGYFGTQATISKLYQQAFLQSVRDGSAAQDYEELYALMDQNRAGNVAASAPVITIAGDKDVVIFPSAQKQLTQRLCAAGSLSVELEIYPEITHYTAMAHGRVRALSWMHDITNGVTPPTDCGKAL